MAILVIAALIILGPERLPSAMSWVAKALKQAREYATGAQTQLKDELGPEFEEFKKPFEELRGMRGMTPKGVITKHLFDGDDSIFTGNFDSKPNPPAPLPPAQSPSAQSPSAQNPPAQIPSAGPDPAPGAPTRYDSEAT